MPAAPAQPARSRLWLHGLLCGVLVMLAAPAALLAAVLGLPALLAWLLGGAQSRPLARALALAATAAALPALAALWRAGIAWPACFDLLSEPRRLAFAWALQAGFWLFGELAPLAIRLALDAAAAREAAHLTARRAVFERDWGLPPADEDLP